MLVLLSVTALSAEAQSNEPELFFNTGFETLTGTLAGVDSTVPAPNNFSLLDFGIDYVGGDSTQRGSGIVDDPTGRMNPSTGEVNQVMEFWQNETVRHPSDPDGATSRVQSYLIGPSEEEVFQSVRMYLNEDFLLLKQKSSMSWLMLQEMWIRESWSGNNEYPFRIGIYMDMDSSGNFFLRMASSEFTTERTWEDVWEVEQRDVSLPIGEWFTATTYLKSGDENNGKVKFTIQKEGEAEQVVFDETNWTYDPDDIPRNIEIWNPHKLYSSEINVNYIRDNGGTMRVYWDDWQVWKGNPVPEPSGVALVVLGLGCMCMLPHRRCRGLGPRPRLAW